MVKCKHCGKNIGLLEVRYTWLDKDKNIVIHDKCLKDYKKSKKRLGEKQKEKTAIKKNTEADENIIRIFVLIKIAPGFEYDVYSKLEKIDEIIQCYPVFGDYDFIVEFTVKPPLDTDNIIKFVNNKIRSINGIIKTNTLTLPRM